MRETRNSFIKSREDTLKALSASKVLNEEHKQKFLSFLSKQSQNVQETVAYILKDNPKEAFSWFDSSIERMKRAIANRDSEIFENILERFMDTVHKNEQKIEDQRHINTVKAQIDAL